MASFFEIPLNSVSERFGIDLPDGTSLAMTVVWRNRGGAGWVLDLDTPDGVRLVSGIPMVAGTDLLGQFRHLGIPGALVLVSDGASPYDDPTFAGLGTDQHLYYVTP